MRLGDDEGNSSETCDYVEIDYIEIRRIKY